MSKLVDLCRVTTATTGTGDITLGAVVTSFLSFAQAGVNDGDTVTYGILNGPQREVGRAVYNASAGTLTGRTVLRSTNGNAAINLTGNSQVYLTMAAEDVVSGNMPRITRCLGGSGNPLSFTSGNVGDDTGAAWASANPTRITVPAGVTRIRLTGLIVGSYASFYSTLSKNASVLYQGGEAHDTGTGGANAGTSNGKMLISPWLDVSPGDYFELGAVATGTGAVTYSGWLQAEWPVAAAVLGGGGNASSGGVSALAALSDVGLSSPIAAQALVFNGTKWVNTTILTLPSYASATQGQVLVRQSDGSVKWGSDFDDTGTPTAGAHKTWRVAFLTFAVGNADFRIPELEFRTTAGTTQTATGGNYVQYGVNTAIYHPQYSFDGVTNTSADCYVITTPNTSPSTSTALYLGYAYASAMLVREVAIYLGGSASPYPYPTDINIDYSDDGGTTWTTALQVRGKTNWVAGLNTIAMPQSTPAQGAQNSLAHLRDVVQNIFTAANTGKVLRWNNALGMFDLVSLPIGVPVGGTTGQALVKNSATDGDLKWASLGLVPAGGTAGQILSKNTATDYDTKWIAAPTGGGTTSASRNKTNAPPTTTLLATQLKQGTGSGVLTNDTTDDGALLQNTGTAMVFQMRTASVALGTNAFRVAVRCQFISPAGAYDSTAGVAMASSATNCAFFGMLYPWSSDKLPHYYTGGYKAGTKTDYDYNTVAQPGLQWFSLNFLGDGTVNCDVSFEGRTWITYANRNLTSFFGFTPTMVGIAVGSGAAPAGTIGRFLHYFDTDNPSPVT